MEGIEFERENRKQITENKPAQSWAVKLVRKIGGKHIENDMQATGILLIFILIMIILSIYNFFF